MVALSSPANNSTLGVGLPQMLVANATASNGTIANVQFFANNVLIGSDNTFPYNLAWTPTAVGTYAITVVACYAIYVGGTEFVSPGEAEAEGTAGRAFSWSGLRRWDREAGPAGAAKPFLPLAQSRPSARLHPCAKALPR